VNGSVIELASTSVGLLSSAPEITELRRRLEVDGNTLTYELWMAMQDIPLTHHVKSVLERVPPSS